MNGGGGVANFEARDGAPRVGVLRLEVEAREGTTGAASEWRRKHGMREKKSDRRRRQHPFKGGGGDAAEGRGSGEVGRCVEGLKEGGQLGRRGMAGSGSVAMRVSA
jgi:hypothetical protein